jgi:hypothetical protein
MKNNVLVTHLLRLREEKISILQVAQEALQRLSILHVEATPTHAELIKAFLKVIDMVNAEATERSLGAGELRYHNSAHVADTIVALSFFLLNSQTFLKEDCLIGLIAMAGHDLGHQGKTNHELGCSQEVLTANFVDLNACTALTKTERQHIKRLIVGTDPSLVEQNHKKYKKNPLSKNLLLQVLLNEADIAASILEPFKFTMTTNLLKERGQLNPTIDVVESTYDQFRCNVLVSSTAAVSFLCPA